VAHAGLHDNVSICKQLTSRNKKLSELIATIRNWSHILIVALGATNDALQKSLRLCCFKSDRDAILIYSSSKYASSDSAGLSIWHHTFKTTAMTSFHREKCCNLVSAHATASVCLLLPPAARQQFQLQFIHNHCYFQFLLFIRC